MLAIVKGQAFRSGNMHINKNIAISAPLLMGGGGEIYALSRDNCLSEYFYLKIKVLLKLATHNPTTFNEPSFIPRKLINCL